MGSAPSTTDAVANEALQFARAQENQRLEESLNLYLKLRTTGVDFHAASEAADIASSVDPSLRAAFIDWCKAQHSDIRKEDVQAISFRAPRAINLISSFLGNDVNDGTATDDDGRIKRTMEELGELPERLSSMRSQGTPLETITTYAQQELAAIDASPAAAKFINEHLLSRWAEQDEKAVAGSTRVTRNRGVDDGGGGGCDAGGGGGGASAKK